ncbi:peptidase M50 [Pyrobaculum islandicum DSM 4184]|uniref:Peptidase M50 n=1 Tax=Pyrobaculum islandicum (strain DSM 4184 / JCM 9189 / GEO3) TaxID=384616 RepID=A1RU39_PYRIL|nr:site-2 protease family protein [Pyrobaculum islandicum]ABL88471.1 peptidase M50 [Pyrobaculum islandicum DSM 4184]
MYDQHLRKRELIDLAIALVVLSIGFAISMAGRGIFGGINWGLVARYLPVTFFVLLFAFIGHELAHRQVARRLGYFAMFQADYTLLPLAIILPLFFGFVFAAPGAVVISPFRLYGRGDERRDVFYIAAAGPLANVAFALLGILFMELFKSGIFWFFAYINAWLAFFNMLPLPTLDGSKMAKSNFIMWLILIITAGWLVYILW